MGNSKSKSTTTNTYNTTVVNQSDLNLLNENINNFVSNTVVDQAASCSATVTQTQNIDLTGFTAKGDITIDGVSQNQKAAITFDCVQLSAFQNDIANGVLTQYMDAIKNSYDTSSIAQMTAAAQTSAKNEFGTTGGSSSNSKSNNTYNFDSKTIVNQDIQNIVQNSITNNMSLKDMQDCMSSVKNTQNITVKDFESTDGNIKILNLSQTQAADLYAKCMQEKNNANKISNNIVTDLGLTVTTEAKTTSSAEMESKSAAESSNTGAFQSMGEGVGNVFRGVGDMWGTVIGSVGGLFSGDSSSSIICLIILVILCVIGGVGYYMYKKNGSGGDFDMDEATEMFTKKSGKHMKSRVSQNDYDEDEDDDDYQSGGGLKINPLRLLITIFVLYLIYLIYQKQNE